MRCLMCENLTFSHICNPCQKLFLTPSLYKRKLPNNIEVISFYKYDEIKSLLHTKHTDLGYLTHKKVLTFLNKSEIAVVPSRWEEPFGRTSLESSSRACATIISDRGGLPETTDHCVILKRLNSKELYNEIKKLIINTSYRKKIQLDGFNNVKHLIKVNSNLQAFHRIKLF